MIKAIFGKATFSYHMRNMQGKLFLLRYVVIAAILIVL